MKPLEFFFITGAYCFGYLTKFIRLHTNKTLLVNSAVIGYGGHLVRLLIDHCQTVRVSVIQGGNKLLLLTRKV